jgi:TrmH family RNA methyltransferase
VGAVLRSARAFGASCVAIGPGSADPFGPKAVRASMGAVFSVPVVRVASVSELPGVLVAMVPKGGVDLWRLRTEGWDANANEHTILVGSEREGLPRTLVDQADHRARIPIATDSLNAAMAATIALYELTRIAAQ